MVPYAVLIIPIFFGLAVYLASGDGASMIVSGAGAIATFKRTAFYVSLVLAVLYIPVVAASFRASAKLSALQEQLKAQQEELSALAYDNAQLLEELRGALDWCLISLARGPLEFGSRQGCTERISMFVHDGDGSFLLIGRWSLHPEFSTKRRVKYPAHGCIDKAWRHGQHFDNGYPDPAKGVKYTKHAKRDGLKEDEISGIRMKSRLFFGYRVADTRAEKSLAVVVVEATEPDRYTVGELSQVFANGSGILLGNLVERLASRVLPSLDAASKAGF